MSFIYSKYAGELKHFCCLFCTKFRFLNSRTYRIRNLRNQTINRFDVLKFALLSRAEAKFTYLTIKIALIFAIERNVFLSPIVPIIIYHYTSTNPNTMILGYEKKNNMSNNNNNKTMC